MSNLSDFVGGRMVRKFQLLTSGSGATWTLPTNLLGDTVWVTAIAGGEAGSAGQGGSFIQQYPYTASASVTYTVGAGGTYSAGGENGADTVFGTITLQGGGETDCSGARGYNATHGPAEKPPGPFGTFSNSGNGSTTKGGGGLMLGGTIYGQGGASTASGTGGAILLEWWEKL